jgi:hypothetical protein
VSRRMHLTALKTVPVVAAAGLALAACGTEPTSIADRNPPPAAATPAPPVKGTGGAGNVSPGGAAYGGTDDTGTRPNGTAPIPGVNGTTISYEKHKKDQKASAPGTGTDAGTQGSGGPGGASAGTPAGAPAGKN